MKISIITVTYNCASTIAQCLRSVAEQSHPDIEHIVVDGRSTDATLDIVHEQTIPPARIVSEPDQGIYDAMNKGLRLATGEMIGFLNADDLFNHTEVVASIAASAAAHPQAAAVYGDLVYVRQNQTDQVLRRWRSGAFSARRLRFGWMPPHPTFYIRSSHRTQLGWFDDTLRIAADYDYMLRCLNRPGTQAAYIPDVLVRMRSGGASNRSLAAMLTKSREDLYALNRNRVGGLFTLLCKNVRKLPQFL